VTAGSRVAVQSIDYHLTDRVAIVTGGGGGIGRAIALTLAQAGADIVIADIVPERCEEAVERVKELGRSALGVPTDVAQTDQVRAMVEQADKRFGRLDILVNNAGGVGRRPFLEQSEKPWRRHIDLNLVSMLAATSAAVPVMIRGGRGGAIINISSIVSTLGVPGGVVYSGTKGAVGAVESKAEEECSVKHAQESWISNILSRGPSRYSRRDILV